MRLPFSMITTSQPQIQGQAGGKAGTTKAPGYKNGERVLNPAPRFRFD
ncbi:hypothetical protein DET1542 [Dehalococcoides mccartyi 195]|uniref:Uncharacterized protein n=1 Tax=Dehalococcoides mccartyi (strain ATCC BAA-2266 / KCTC 15142 / 195) TaxID=243164 RepID=Q3Z6A9_DEHM1|nr:hypothetical protein DET1542 [Dehalococcoides mccartyi 195]